MSPCSTVDVLLEPFEQAHARIVAREDALRCASSTSSSVIRQQPIGALRQRLHDEVVAVAIDDERRKQIAFAVHEPIRGGVDVEPLAERDRLLEPRSPEAAIDGHVVLRQDPQRDLRAIAVKSARQKPAVRPDDAHHGAGSARPSATSARYTQKCPLRIRSSPRAETVMVGSMVLVQVRD